MVDQTPLQEARMTPVLTDLPAGSELWRCHRSEFGPGAFNDTYAHPLFGGSRFDGTETDPYPFLYAAREPTTALSEVFLRSLSFSPPAGTRLVPRAQAEAYSVSKVRTTARLTLVSLLTEEALAGVFQTSWLLETEDFGKTRYWSSEIRRQAPSADGLLWPSHRHRPREALVLFGDRGAAGAVRPVDGCSFDLATAHGRAEANRLLRSLRAAIA